MKGCLALALLLGTASCGHIGGVCEEECASSAGSGTNDTGGGPGRTIPEGTRVVGYLATYHGGLRPWATPELLNRLTHVHIAFPSVTSSGVTFDDPTDVKEFVVAAHAAGVKVLTSLGGAAGSDQIAAQVQPATLPALVSHIMQHVEEYGFDGVDVDIEGDAVNASYGAFVDALSVELEPRGKLLTAAVANWYEERIAEATLLQFDYIGVMAYDACGTWTDPCDHSTLALARDNLAFWVGTRGMPADRTTLGVPFYGRSWGDPNARDTIGYGDILARYPDAWQKDWVQDGAYTLSYNGEATMRSKVELGLAHGGIMIWELGNDALGQRSLLRLINDSF